MVQTGKSEEEVKKEIKKEERNEMRNRKKRKLVVQRMAETGKSEDGFSLLSPRILCCSLSEHLAGTIARHFGDELAAVVAEVSEIIIIPILWGEKPQANHSPSNFFVKNSSK